MQIFLLVIYLLVVLTLVAVVLLQRSEGGGLGSLSSNNGLANNRGESTPLSRLTVYLAAGFFFLALLLLVLQAADQGRSSVDKLLSTDSLQKTTAPAPEQAMNHLPSVDTATQAPQGAAKADKQPVAGQAKPKALENSAAAKHVQSAATKAEGSVKGSGGKEALKTSEKKAVTSTADINK